VIIAFGLQIECEPEYLMGEFDQNPDIDEKPPIPLRDALEKMKPFLMAYEGIQSQEEWEVTFNVLYYSLIDVFHVIQHCCLFNNAFAVWFQLNFDS
jgi:hypothetical protein